MAVKLLDVELDELRLRWKKDRRHFSGDPPCSEYLG